jgi:transcriptional regulator with XRE-family HTH domain
MIDDLAYGLFVALASTTVSTPGERIRRARELRGMTREQVRDATGVKLTTIKRIELDRVHRSKAIPVLLEYFGLSFAESADHESPSVNPQDPPLSQATFLQLWARLYEVYREQTGDPGARFPLGVGEPPPERLLSDAYTVDEDELDREHRERPS